ncbi:hypothetical protein ACFOWM_03900 [Ferruginibacter yonginensis]|uniref:DUF4878 domain-containing protein n=1 Tax=Ferruginibacter yonginensis TaxID=1310416 RepID=A0ABV8QSJ0_9BACT
MKKLLFAIAVVSTALFVSCKGSSSGSPEAVLSQFFDAMSKKDMAKVKELCTPESAQMLGFMEMGMKDGGKTNEMEKYDKSKVDFGTPVINGDNAKVPVKDKKSGSTINFPMKKVNGQWKVAFDKTSVMEMGMETMKDKNINLTDSISKGLDELKNIDADTLKKEMQNALDTAKKEMK